LLCSTLKMETINTCETSVYWQTTRCLVPDNSHLWRSILQFVFNNFTDICSNHEYSIFLHLQIWGKQLLRIFVMLFFCLSARNSSAVTRRTYNKHDIWVLFRTPVEKIQVSLTSDKINWQTWSYFIWWFLGKKLVMQCDKRMCLQVKYPLFFTDFEETSVFSGDF
jgi:hypothetical protein